ncbi:invasion associated locus B family protein [Bartonella sp. HY329]|uniref:invasion associated locus B family protein n=1 Tax=unclassified Bartonella TaxID=2645622 RepID=UPI0021C8F803|nr:MULTISPECIES: invasion associated locus B family protein [unclassified Bartonella]UXM96420.1 invasion associated locus B family protein [Bartonella sp. HY329]UXN10743.1 invasion associated locus B family protein [Bartonella sp. HY328]
MFGKTFVAASIMTIGLTLGLATAAMAQSPTRLNQFDYWGAYSYKAGNSTVCYILSAPTKQEPSSVNHGDNFFLISKRPDGSASFEPQFMAGYNLRNNVTVTIDGKGSFSLFTKEKSAWIETSQNESKLVAAMRGGTTMVVKAVSARGTNTTYTYSLKGITAALNSMKNCK